MPDGRRGPRNKCVFQRVAKAAGSARSMELSKASRRMPGASLEPINLERQTAMRTIEHLQMLGTLFILIGLFAMPAWGYNPKLISLDVGQAVTDSFGGSKSFTVKVVDLQEFSEQGCWQGGMRTILYKALVTVEVNGVRGVVGVGPFYMPVVVNGLRIGGEVTKGFSNSSAIPLMSTDVRLSAKDASVPWYEPGTFVFPIKDYRWGAMAFQNAWLGFHNMAGGKNYYHYGIDFGGLHPNHIELVSMIDQGTISKWGVGTRLTNSSLGLSIRYYHMVDQYLRSDLGNGSVLKKGEMFGYLGNQGNGNDAHVHVDAWYGDQVVNIHPLLVQAYFETFNEPLSFPGHKRHTLVDRPIELDGSNSVAPEGRTIVSYLWQFTDGTTATTPQVRRTYSTRGTYSEELTVTDSTGAKATNSVMVFVYPANGAVDAPYAETLNHWPIRGIEPGQQVTINCSGPNMTSNITLNFGDGVTENVSSVDTTEHTWQKPGEYTLTFQGDGPGGHGIFKRRVIVGAKK